MDIRQGRAHPDESPVDALHRGPTNQTGEDSAEHRLRMAAMDTEFTLTQKRALAVATVIAILFGAYFLRGYFILVVVAAVAAYLFSPLYARLNKRFGTGLSATLTLLAAIAMVIVPLSLFVLLAVVQITNMVERVAEWVGRTDLSALGDQALRFVNDALSRVPFIDVTVTPDSLRDSMATVAQEVGQWLLGLLQGAAGGVFGGITAAILFLYVFISLLTNRDAVLLLIRRLNPLGEEITDLYMSKMGAMVKGTVMGQFVIAVCQGVAGAASIYIAGFHQGFFLFAVLLSALAVIPLGSGIISIPFGIGMILFGNVFGGVFVIVFHLIVVTNIDNFLRPILVPRAARLDSALMLLAVFAGIAMFGAWGIVIGPVLMIIIVTTISVYLSVYKGVPMDEPDEEDEKPKRRNPFWWLGRRLKEKAAPVPVEEKDDEKAPAAKSDAD
jgi:predicted PurR-regulated permease PerM